MTANAGDLVPPAVIYRAPFFSPRLPPLQPATELSHSHQK